MKWLVAEEALTYRTKIILFCSHLAYNLSKSRYFIEKEDDCKRISLT